MAHRVLMILIRILSVVFFCLLLAYMFVAASRFAFDVFSDSAYQASGDKVISKEIEVKAGDSVSVIAEALEKANIVEDDIKFSLALRCLDGSNEIKPGIYTVSSDMKPSEILKVISQKEE